MAVQVKAKGNGPNTGMPRNVAPTKYVNPTVDEKRPVRTYGNNHDATPSSLSPGHKSTDGTSLADDLKRGQDDGEGVLDSIIKGGVHTDLSWQTREIDDKNVATHPAMKPANSGGAPSGVVPAKLGQQAFDPNSVRKPGA